MKEQCSSATTINGGLCVMTHGMTMMQLWSVDNLDTQASDTVAMIIIFHHCSIGGISTDFAHFGFGTGEIEVACSGDEQTLLQCNATTSHDCSHYEDAGVICGTNLFTHLQVLHSWRLAPSRTSP